MVSTVLYPERLPKAILTTLGFGPVKRTELYAIAAAVAGNKHAAAVAIERLADKGLVTCEIRLTRKGRKVLRGAT